VKISASTVQPFKHEPAAKPAATRAKTEALAAAGTDAAASGNPSTPKAEFSKPAKTADHGARNETPPGLERVLARLQSTPASERNAGQSTALDRISRNLARYAEVQAIGQAPANTAAAATPSTATDTSATATTSSSDAGAVLDTTA